MFLEFALVSYEIICVFVFMIKDYLKKRKEKIAEKTI